MARTKLPTAVTALVLTIVCIGCTDSPKAGLVGTWRDAAEDTTLTLHEDGTFAAIFQNESGGTLEPAQIAVSGTWRLSGDYLVFSIGRSSYRNEDFAGVELSEKILEAGGDTLRTVETGGRTCVYSRVSAAD